MVQYNLLDVVPSDGEVATTADVNRCFQIAMYIYTLNHDVPINEFLLNVPGSTIPMVQLLNAAGVLRVYSEFGADTLELLPNQLCAGTVLTTFVTNGIHLVRKPLRDIDGEKSKIALFLDPFPRTQH